jgi:hypothetical protein
VAHSFENAIDPEAPFQPAFCLKLALDQLRPLSAAAALPAI